MKKLQTLRKYNGIVAKALLPFRRKTYKYQVSVCCIVKDEGPYLPEWIAYHLTIGVEHFYLYDNGSAVPVSTVLSEYVQKNIVSVEVVPGKAMQMPVYTRCIREKGHENQWIAFIDADEFIVLKDKPASLPQFLTAYRKYGGLGISWLVFGSAGHLKKQQGQLHTYTKHTPTTHPINTHIKSIVQPRYVEDVPLTTPHHFFYRSKKYCVNEHGTRICGAFTPHTSDKIRINHYVLRSLEEYHEKISRGRSDVDTARDMQQFYEVNRDATETAVPPSFHLNAL